MMRCKVTLIKPTAMNDYNEVSTSEEIEVTDCAVDWRTRVIYGDGVVNTTAYATVTLSGDRRDITEAWRVRLDGETDDRAIVSLERPMDFLGRVVTLKIGVGSQVSK